MPLPIRVTIRTQALPRQAELALRAARQRLNRRMADMLMAMTKSNFGPVDNGYRPFPWEPYKRNYGPGKRKGDPATLIKSGLLYSSIQAQASNQWGQVSAEGSRPYAFAHQFGYAPNNLPARPYFPVYRTPSGFILHPRSEKEILAELSAQIQRIVNRAR